MNQQHQINRIEARANRLLARINAVDEQLQRAEARGDRTVIATMSDKLTGLHNVLGKLERQRFALRAS